MQKFRHLLTILEVNTLVLYSANEELPTCRPKLYIFNSISPVKSASNTLLAMSEREKRMWKKEREVAKKGQTWQKRKGGEGDNAR